VPKTFPTLDADAAFSARIHQITTTLVLFVFVAVKGIDPEQLRLAVAKGKTLAPILRQGGWRRGNLAERIAHGSLAMNRNVGNIVLIGIPTNCDSAVSLLEGAHHHHVCHGGGFVWNQPPRSLFSVEIFWLCRKTVDLLTTYFEMFWFRPNLAVCCRYSFVGIVGDSAIVESFRNVLHAQKQHGGLEA
jgi:hypothetical protein